MSHAFQKLVEIMKRLRAPDGCPWDLKQNHKTLVNYLLEEAYEVIDAIENKDDENLKEELGDLLLQIVFHAEIARQEGRFDIEDVIHGISEKLIRRHPHVFDGQNVRTAEEVQFRWDEIKRKEKEKKFRESFSKMDSDIRKQDLKEISFEKWEELWRQAKSSR